MSTESSILKSCHVVAVVGCSANEERASYRVAKYLKEHGYKVIPVNPALKEVLGEVCYPDLTSIPESVEVVDIFRKSEDVPSIVEQAVKIGAKAVWMQEGIVNDNAAGQARAANIMVVMDRCMLKEHQHLQSGK
jgi:predicted CoA-binding protein